MAALRLLLVLHHILRARRVDPSWIARQGLLAVKIAQTFALRADMLDPARCDALASLLSNAGDPVPADAIDQLLAQSTAAGWREAFERIEPTPLASASVGQVHAGRLRDGRDVVIKVVKRNAARAFERDVRAALRIVRTAIAVYPALRRVADPEGILESMRESTLDELDLRIEAKHQALLRQLQATWSQKYDLKTLRFPTIEASLSGQHVLVSDHIEGATIDTLLREARLPYTTLLELFRIHGFFLFCVGTFHGDLHPGNVIVRGDELWFVDTGALGRASEHLRSGLFHFMAHLSDDDYDGCATALNAMAAAPIDGPRLERFRRAFLAIYGDFRGKTVAEKSLTRTMMETIRSGVLHGMRFERGMYPVIKSLMYLDGMVLRCNPHAILMRDMRRFIADFSPHLPSPQ